jgi:hypothetical protein
MHHQRRFHWPGYIGRSEVLVRLSDSAQAEIVITLKFDRFPAHGLALCAHVRSHPLCSSTPRFTPTTQSPYPVSRASRGWLTHTCASAGPIHSRYTLIPAPRLQNTTIPSQTGILDHTSITHTPGYAPLPTELLSKTMLPLPRPTSLALASSCLLRQG